MKLTLHETLYLDFWTYTALPDELEAIRSFFARSGKTNPFTERSGVFSAHNGFEPSDAAALRSFLADLLVMA